MEQRKGKDRIGKESSLEKGLIHAEYVNNDSKLELRHKALIRHGGKSINTDSRQNLAKPSGPGVFPGMCLVWQIGKLA